MRSIHCHLNDSAHDLLAYAESQTAKTLPSPSRRFLLIMMNPSLDSSSDFLLINFHAAFQQLMGTRREFIVCGLEMPLSLLASLIYSELRKSVVLKSLVRNKSNQSNGSNLSQAGAVTFSRGHPEKT